MMTDDLWQAFEVVEFLELHAGWPNGRGWLAETAACVEAVRIVRRENDYWKAKLKIPNG